MMIYTIRHRWTGNPLWEGDADSIRDALMKALAAKGNILPGDDLIDADLTPFRDDVWAVLSAAPAEAEAVLAALRAGKVDGSCYQGKCACLIGTIANARQCTYQDLGILRPDSCRMAELWFTRISPGDTPDTNHSAKLAAEWIEDWLTRMRATFGPSS